MSRAAAVKAKCIDCIYDSAAPGSKLVQTTLCSVTTCPLWPYRPKTKSAIPESVLKYYGVATDDPCLSQESRKNGAFLAKNGQSGIGRDLGEMG